MDQARARLGESAAAFEYADPPAAKRPTVYFWIPGWVPVWCARYRKPGGGAAGQHKQEREKWQARKARIDYLERRKRLIDVSAFCEGRLKPLCDELRQGIELIGQVSPDAQQVMVESLEKGLGKAGINGHDHSRNGST